jgi:hypothetical protein
MVPVFTGVFLWTLACALGIGAVAISPIIVWPAAVGGLLPFSYTTLAWLDIASLPGCFLLGVAAVITSEVGSSLVEG